MAQIVLDTNILIEILKNNTQTLRAVEGLNGGLCISAITVMELYFGARDKTELSKLKKFIELFEVIEINADISSQAILLIEKYAKSHHLDIPDALIAASVLVNKLPLMTYNRKDFKYIDGLMLIS
ncbi:type II toxin-antitoxin system VapC family toxin [Sulfuricurvum sp.]|uniref:type II toxin-antitoxin system VapC family toxin n=1 Tax=Sulfuricurvum sp. TaxID=2025608 RepID=UPI003BB62080